MPIVAVQNTLPKSYTLFYKEIVNFDKTRYCAPVETTKCTHSKLLSKLLYVTHNLHPACDDWQRTQGTVWNLSDL